MKRIIFVLLLPFVFAGCLEIEQAVTLNNDGSGKLELKTDMSQIMAMLSMMGKDEKINKDTIIYYKSYLDTATSLSPTEKELISKASWKVRMNSDDGVFDLTLRSDFKDIKEIEQLYTTLQKWDNIDVLDEVMKDVMPQDKGNGMDDIGMGKGKGNPNLNDLTKDYFKTTWQSGKLKKSLDTVAYKRIDNDDNLNSFKQLGELGQGQGGDKILEQITIISKFVLPRPAKKAEGKNVKLSDDKKTVTISCPLSDIYTEPKNFEYNIEY